MFSPLNLGPRGFHDQYFHENFLKLLIALNKETAFCLEVFKSCNYSVRIDILNNLSVN